ncbi:MAG: divalent-cation tolerance protein CutA [Candidatus Verstraetearchaeota archaeon]|nr:divalent-cation tolerance protein CutA [Candidatus Verstraetearchaeota archaeon]
MSIVSIITVGNAKEAETIAKRLVEEKLAACVNIIPSVKSIYRWNEKVEVGEEAMLLVKTKKESFDKIKKRVVELHSYEVPEIIALEIFDGLESYLEWISSNVD